jgi:hypothetical protein
VNVKAIVVLQRQRQFREKAPLNRAESAAAPLDRGLGFGIHGFRGGADGGVVIAAHGQGAILDEAHHRLDGPFRIGAVSDVVAEADDALRAVRPRVIEARAKSLPVGMDIREKRQQHDFLRADPIRRACDRFDGYQTTGRRRHAIGLTAGTEVAQRNSRRRGTMRER